MRSNHEWVEPSATIPEGSSDVVCKKKAVGSLLSGLVSSLRSPTCEIETPRNARTSLGRRLRLALLPFP